MEKSEFVKKLEKIIDMVKTEDDGFEYGGKVIFYKEDDSNYEVSVMNIEMNLEVEANVMAGMMIWILPALRVRFINKRRQRL